MAIEPRLNKDRTMHEGWKGDLVWMVIFVGMFAAWFIGGCVILGSTNIKWNNGSPSVNGKFAKPGACSMCPDDPFTNRRLIEVTGGRKLTTFEEALEDAHQARHLAQRRRLEAHRNANASVWTLLEEKPGAPACMILLTFVVGAVWVFALEKFSKPLIYATALLKVVLFAALGIWIKNLGGADGTKMMILFFALAALSLFMFFYYRDAYDLSARIMTCSCEFLSENKGVWGVTLGVYVAYLGLLFFYTFCAMRSALIYEYVAPGTEMRGIPVSGSGCSCNVAPAAWANNYVQFMCAMFIWITFFLNYTRLTVIATSVSNWYFHSNDPDRLSSPALTGLKWALTTSSGAIAFGSLICSIVEKIKRTVNSRFAWCHPVGCLIKVIMICVATLIEAVTKFALIVHVMTAKPFCDAVKDTFDLLKRRFMGAIIVDQAGEDCLKLGAYVFSLAFGFATWAWMDDALGLATLQAGSWDSYSFTFYILLVLYFVFSKSPMVAIFVVAVITPILQAFECKPDGSGMCIQPSASSPNQYGISAICAPCLACIFIGSVSHIIFDYMAHVILESMDSVFICYAIEKDANMQAAQPRFQELYVVLAETPAGKKMMSAQNVAGVGDPMPTAQAYAVPNTAV